MKKLILLLLFIPLVSFGQTYNYNINAKIDDDPLNKKALQKASENLSESLREANRIKAEEWKDNWSKVEFDNFSTKASKYRYVVFKENENYTRSFVKQVIDLLQNSTYNYEIINLNKPKRTFKTLPKEFYIKDDVIFLNIIKTRIPVWSVSYRFFLQDKSNVIFESAHKNKTLDEVLKPLISNQILSSNNVESKKQAKKEILELKEYLDLGIITQEEFDKKAESLKKILLDN